MYPHERSLVKQLSDKPFAIIGVNSDRDREKLKETIKEKKLNWRSFWNGEKGTQGPISTAWNVSGWPTVYILDENGVIRFKGHGGDLDKVITKLLGEMGHKVSIKPHEEVLNDETKTDSDEGDKESKESPKENDKKDSKETEIDK